MARILDADKRHDALVQQLAAHGYDEDEVIRYGNMYGYGVLQKYADAADKLRGTDFYDQLTQLSQYTYEPTFGAKIAEMFGDFSARTNFMNEASANIDENINALLEALRKQNYEDPQNQAARLEAAGINPNLQGNSGLVSSGEAGDTTDATPDVTPVSQGPSFLETLGEGIGTVASVASILEGGVGVAVGVENLLHTRNMNAIDEWKALTEAVPGLTKFLSDLTPSEDWVDPVTGKTIVAGTRLDASQISSYVDSLGLRPNAAKMFKSMIGRVQYDQNGNPTTGYKTSLNKTIAEGLESGQKAVKVMASAGYAPELQAWAANYTNLTGELNVRLAQAKLRAEAALAEYNASRYGAGLGASEAAAAGAEAQFNEEYYNHLDSEAAAEATNAEAGNRQQVAIAARYQNEVDAAILGFYAQRIREIEDLKVPDDVKNNLKFGIYSARNEYMSQMMARREALVHQAGGQMTEKDWYDFGLDVGKEILDLIPGKGLAKKLFKGKGKPKSRSGGSRGSSIPDVMY